MSELDQMELMKEEIKTIKDALRKLRDKGELIQLKRRTKRRENTYRGLQPAR